MRKKVMMWALTYRCNLTCEYCYLRAKENLNKSEISFAQTLKIAEKIISSKEWKPEAVWLTGGEPTIKEQLCDLIQIFESNRIKTVINTNGVLDEKLALSVLSSKPSGITISLDFVDIANNKLRSHTEEVLNTIQLMAENKYSNTILGISIVLHKENATQLSEMAKKLTELGVNYLSINPLYQKSQAEIIKDLSFIDSIMNLKSNSEILLPCDNYLNILFNYYKGLDQDMIMCPASQDFFFIAPWGQLFPCSNEFWHERNLGTPVFAYDGETLGDNISALQKSISHKVFHTHSPCFGARCLGCWKLYFDEIFTHNEAAKG